MSPQNIASIVNSLSLIFGSDDQRNVDAVLDCLADLDGFITNHPTKLRSGAQKELRSVLSSFDRQGASFLRRDPSSWVIELCITSKDGDRIVVSATLWTILVAANGLIEELIVSDNAADARKIAVAAAKRIPAVLEIAGNRRPDVAKQTKFVLNSQRVYDSLQALQHFDQYFKKHSARSDQDVVVVSGLALITASLVQNTLPHQVRLVTRSDVSAFRKDPNVDVVSSLDWHWGARSTATVEALTGLVQSALPANPEAVSGRSIFLSLELEKRVWVEQQATLTECIRILRDRHGVKHVCVNGLTAPESLPPDAPFFPEILQLEEKFLADIAVDVTGVTFASLHRKTLSEKLGIVRSCCYFIAPAGSASLLPILCDVPGILYGTPDFLRSSQNLLPQDRERFKLVDPQKVVRLEEDYSVQKYSWSQNKPQGQSYSMKPEEFIADFEKHAEEVLAKL